MKGKGITDKLRRISVAENEVTRMALKFITHNESIPLKQRYIAQFKLSALPKKTSEHFLSRRCIVTFRGKSIIPEFNVSRIVFREQALTDRIQGVTRSKW